MIRKLIKAKSWTRLSDLKYWFYRMPLNVISVIPAILKGEPKVNGMTWRDYISLAKATADAQCGRVWMETSE